VNALKGVALALFVAGAACAAADSDDRVIEGKAAAGEVKRLALEAGVGEVKLEVGADDAIVWRVALEADPNHHGLFGRKRRRDEVRADLEKVTVEKRGSGERAELVLVLPSSLDEDDFDQRWTVTVPKRFAVDLELDVGSMSISGVAGGVEASVDVGDLRIDVPGGAVEGKVDVGDIELKSGEPGSGEISLEADVGGVDLTLAGRRIRTDGGYGPGETLRLDGKGGPKVRLSVDVGDIEAVIGR